MGVVEKSYFDLKEVMEITTLGRSTIYTLMKEGKLPKNVKISARRTAWRVDEVRAWTQDRDSGAAFPAAPVEESMIDGLRRLHREVLDQLRVRAFDRGVI